MRKGLFFGLLFCFLCHSLNAQSILRMEEKKFNFGAKVGFNATLPVVNSLRVLDFEANQFQTSYQVGYLASIFFRFNIQRFYIQPSPSWHYGRSHLDFTITFPEIEGEADPPIRGNLRMHTQSLELPVLLGYHLVKQGPYGLSLMVGPKVKYNYKLDYNMAIDDREIRFVNDDTPFGVNIVTGMGVSIGRLFFDFVYEFGLNQTEASFKQLSSSSPESSFEIQLNKRTNVMSMSIGMLF
ncbi:MAG: porin family protein [Parabacteroides sp.]